MSVAQAEEFYGPVLPVLEEKLGAESGRDNWESIVEFMAGSRPSKTPAADRREARARRSASPLFTRAKTQSEKSVTSLARPILPRRLPAQFARNSARQS